MSIVVESIVIFGLVLLLREMAQESDFSGLQTFELMNAVT